MSGKEKLQVNIRPMERKDVDGVLAIERRSSPVQSVLTRRELAAYDPGGPLDLSFVAEVDNKIAGFVLARLTYVGVPVSEVGIIHALAVDRDYRHRNIGTQLLNALSKCCQTEGTLKLRAVVSERASEVKDFFNKLGFHRSDLTFYTKSFETEKNNK